MNEEKTLTVNDLENILGGTPREIAEKMALENPDLHRKKIIEKLKKEKDALLSSKEHQQDNTDTFRKER